MYSIQIEFKRNCLNNIEEIKDNSHGSFIQSIGTPIIFDSS